MKTECGWKSVYFTQERADALQALARLECCNWPSRLTGGVYGSCWQVCVPEWCDGYTARAVAEGESSVCIPPTFNWRTGWERNLPEGGTADDS